MSDFWLSSGHQLLDRDPQGRLVVTDAFLKLYLARPEIMPPPEACLVERALHDRLLGDPRARIDAAEVSDIADRDARENWRLFLSFRETLLVHDTIEAAYLALIRAPRVTTPPLFLNQIVHVILRNALDGESDAFRLRAAELMFRAQRLSIQDGQLLLADEERVDGAVDHAHASPLVAMFGDVRAKTLDVLTPEVALHYRSRSDAHDFVLDFRSGSAGRTALARVIETWVRHLLGVEVMIVPRDRIEDPNWAWFVGLDQEATAIGNAIWRGEEPRGDGRSRILALFELAFADAGDVIDKVAGRPVTLILATTTGRIVRVKPQNILAGLPLRQLAQRL